MRENPGDSRLSELFDALPFSEAEGLVHADSLSDPITVEKLEESWYRFFKGNYQEIVRLAAGGGGG